MNDECGCEIVWTFGEGEIDRTACRYDNKESVMLAEGNIKLIDEVRAQREDLDEANDLIETLRLSLEFAKEERLYQRLEEAQQERDRLREALDTIRILGEQHYDAITRKMAGIAIEALAQGAQDHDPH